MFKSLSEAIVYAQTVQPTLNGYTYRLNTASSTHALILLLKQHGYQTKDEVQNALRLLRQIDPDAFIRM